MPLPVTLLHVGQMWNVSFPPAIYSVALPGLSFCLTLLLELTFAGFLPATIHLLDVLLLTYSSNSLRIFMADLPINAVTGKPTAVNFANGSIQYAPDGRSYFLHHSPTSGIKVGEKIRTTSFGQVTAGDALVGHSYGWDARTGLTNSVNNQVSARGDDFSVYLTSANTKNVFPDINVPDSSARAIKGTQDVLGEVRIPAGMPRDESEKLVSQMMTRHGIFAEESSIGREIIDRSVLMRRGHEAVDNAIQSVAAGKNIRLIESLEAQLAKGPRGGVFMAGLPEGHQFHRWSRMADEYEKGGRETALAYLGANPEIRNRQYVSLYCSCCTKSKRVR